MDQFSQQFKILSWNVRGLNCPAKKEDVKQTISLFRPDLICVQETKLSQVENVTVTACFGSDYENNYVYLPADGTRGGIVLAAKSSTMLISNPLRTNHTISADILDQRRNLSWTVTGVYGPQGELDKKMFIRELRNVKHTAKEKWLILGDFNLIYKEQDKN
jgi:exonuclease III